MYVLWIGFANKLFWVTECWHVTYGIMVYGIRYNNFVSHVGYIVTVIWYFFYKILWTTFSK